MNDYFPQDNGIGVRIGNGVKQVLQIIANRFIADNPPIPVKYYLRSSRNCLLSSMVQCLPASDYHNQNTSHPAY